jgi:hypothetical protein
METSSWSSEHWRTMHRSPGLVVTVAVSVGLMSQASDGCRQPNVGRTCDYVERSLWNEALVQNGVFFIFIFWKFGHVVLRILRPFSLPRSRVETDALSRSAVIRHAVQSTGTARRRIEDVNTQQFSTDPSAVALPARNRISLGFWPLPSS